MRTWIDPIPVDILLNFDSNMDDIIENILQNADIKLKVVTIN